MNIVWRRNYPLVLILMAFVLALFSISSWRLIAYNFGEGKEIETAEAVDYQNEIDIFDDSVVHEVQIDFDDGDYEEMITTYKETSEKEYYSVTVTIDGVTIENVGIRLKGNLTLRQSLGTDGGGMMGGEMKMPPEGFEMPANGERPMPGNFQGRALRNNVVPDTVTVAEETTDTELVPSTADVEALALENVDPFEGRSQEAEESNPPFLLKFDEFVAGQTYQGYAEIAVRIGSDEALLSEPLALYLHEQVGQIVPQTSYARVAASGQEPSWYVLCEHIDENYVENNFVDAKGVLYKAGNFTGFEYLGEDPTLYAEKFEQKTRINKDDLAPLIKFMKFVSQSSDEEFSTELGEYLDLESFVRMMALDNLLGNNDSFGGMGSNYYLFYNKEAKQFTILSWDLNLAMGGMGGGMGGARQRPIDMNLDANGDVALPAGDFPFPEDISDEERQEIMEQWLAEGGQDKMGGPGGENNNNVLKERFFANETFAQMYNDEYARLKTLIYDDGLASAKLDSMAKIFAAYNVDNHLMEQTVYDASVEKMQSYIKQQTEAVLTDPAAVMKTMTSTEIPE